MKIIEGNSIIIKNDLTYQSTGIYNVANHMNKILLVDRVVDDCVIALGYSWNYDWIEKIITKEENPEYWL